MKTLLTAVVSQVFREGIVAMGRSTALAATVTGGVLRMPILHTPGTASCFTITAPVRP
jgi:hypothetical protein